MSGINTYQEYKEAVGAIVCKECCMNSPSFNESELYFIRFCFNKFQPVSYCAERIINDRDAE